ncbi:hypothetical protein [Vibrio alginolyticus]|uniref:hypothetical protein n=1 Tax=Vibrio alginolyticus TaxID=663 RepID=UPI001C3D0C48|nr:hypothetical protein [Vibrio alginolyticus]
MVKAYKLPSGAYVEGLIAPPLPTPTPFVSGPDIKFIGKSNGLGGVVTPPPTGKVGHNTTIGCAWDTMRNSLFIQPKSVDLGLVLSASTHSLRVWSLFERELTSDDITAVGTTGMTLSGTTSNVRLPAYGGYADYTLDVSLAVSGVIDAYYRWNFSGVDEDVRTFRITGQRIVVFGIPPQRKMTEQLSWRTEVIRALDGSEQRIRLRENPIVKIKFKSVLGHHTEQGAKAMVYRLGHDSLAIPLWHESVRSSEVIPVGAAEIRVATGGMSVQAGDLLILWSDFYQYETGTVKSVESDKITLTKPLLGSWNKPVVAPVAYGLIDGADFSNYKVSVSEGDVEYTRNSNVPIPADSTYPHYDNIPVYGELLYMRGKSSPESYAPSVNKVDFGIKVRTQKRKYDHPDVAREIFVKMDSPVAAMRFKKFLSYLGGKQKPFWYVSNWWDFDPVGITLSNQTEFRVKDLGFVEYYSGAATRKWVAIKQVGGGWHYRQVSSSAKGPTGSELGVHEVLTLDSTLPFTFSKDTVERMCLMVPVRLDQDDVVLNWDGMAHITTTLRILEVTK